MHSFGTLLVLLLITAATHIGSATSRTDGCLRSPLLMNTRATCKAADLVARASFQKPSSSEAGVSVAIPLPPPWEGPFNCIDEYCLFVNKEFGGGCAVITTEENAHMVAEQAATAREPLPELDSYHVAELPDKGVGLIANRPIRKGEEIMARTPTLMVLDAAHHEMEKTQQAGLYQAAIQKLPAPRQKAFMKQVGHHIQAKIDKNSFRLFVGTSKDKIAHLGMFPEAARMNHDCRPNSQYRITNLTHSTVAARDIAKDEELTVTYIDVMLPRAERKQRLQEWGFNCSCSHCQMTEAEGEASDARLRKIVELEKKLDDFTDTTVTAETGAELVELYERERLDIYLGHVYTRVALNFALFGEVEKSSRYAALAVDAVEREFGPDAGDIKWMKILAEDPQSHWTWGKRRFS